MTATIKIAVADCAAIIAGGMGRPAFAAIQASGLTPILTGEREIDQVALQYAGGTLRHRAERLH